MKVMTLNIWNYTRPWSVRRRLIAELIEREQPDVVGLQETRHDWRSERGRGQGEQLAEMTGYHATFALGQVYIPILRVDEGVTILSHGVPKETVMRGLTMYPHERDDHNRRVCLGITIDYQGVDVAVFNTHFSLSARARESNAVEAAAFVSEQAPNIPAFLMGDLNTQPETAPIRFLTGAAELKGRSADFLDCWTAAHPATPGYTYASSDPYHRIDYVLARRLPNGVGSARIVGDVTDDGVFPSDHLGIVVETTIARG